MKQCLLDTGPMVALFDSSDHYHARSVDFIRNYKGKLVSSLASVTEAIYLLDFSKEAQFALLDWISKGAIELVHVDEKEVVRVSQLFSKYSDLPMDFADGCLVAIAEKIKTTEVASIDSDFYIYRLSRNRKFKVYIGR